MIRFVALALWGVLCFAQTPPGVDEALRARISQFYQFHVDGKFRQAESLVAEDTKDIFYASPKPKYLSFEIARIVYSDNFTRAKAVVLCEQFMLIPGFMDKPMKAPIPSSWKLVDGQWFYFVDPDSLGQTPFGLKSSTNPDGPPPGVKGLPGMPTGDEIDKLLEHVNSLVEVDKDAVNLKAGTSAAVTLTNTSSGPMSLRLQGSVEGVDAKFDHMDLKGGEKAVLSLRARATAKSGILKIEVTQTNQVIPIQINIPERR